MSKDCTCACHNPAVFQPHKEGHGCCEYAQTIDNRPNKPQSKSQQDEPAALKGTKDDS